MPTINRHIGHVLRDLRERHNLTIVELGYAIGFNGKPDSVEAGVRRYELGYRDPPMPTKLLILMYDAYGIPEDWIVRRRKLGLARAS